MIWKQCLIMTPNICVWWRYHRSLWLCRLFPVVIFSWQSISMTNEGILPVWGETRFNQLVFCNLVFNFGSENLKCWFMLVGKMLINTSLGPRMSECLWIVPWHIKIVCVKIWPNASWIVTGLMEDGVPCVTYRCLVRFIKVYDYFKVLMNDML